MDVEAAIESLNGKGQIYIDKVDRWEEAILSYFGRLNYNYKSRYMVEVNASLRRLFEILAQESLELLLGRISRMAYY